MRPTTGTHHETFDAGIAAAIAHIRNRREAYGYGGPSHAAQAQAADDLIAVLSLLAAHGGRHG